MHAFNKARVGLKHHGVLPAKVHTEAIRANVTSFFVESTILIFGVEFDDISLESVMHFGA